MKETVLLRLIPKLKQLDHKKMELVEKATDSCITVQYLEDINRSKLENIKNIKSY